MTRQVPRNGIYAHRVYRNQEVPVAGQQAGHRRPRRPRGQVKLVSSRARTKSGSRRASASPDPAGPANTRGHHDLQMLDGHGNRFDQLFLGALHRHHPPRHDLRRVHASGHAVLEAPAGAQVAQLLPGAIGHRRMQLAAQWFDDKPAAAVPTAIRTWTAWRSNSYCTTRT